jgi:CheY-like chemotaxis protein
VLVVDDNPDMAMGMAMLLEASGYLVKTAHDGPSALFSAREFRPAFVLMDIALPGMTGYELARAFRQDPLLRDATLIAISGYGQHHDRERALAAGFDHHMLKPVEPETLLAMLAERSTQGDLGGKHMASREPERPLNC